MAIVMTEGFDDTAASDVTAKGWSAAMSSMQSGRFDGQCARCASSSLRTKVLPSTYSTLIVGFACRIQAPTTTSNPLLVIAAGATNTLQLFMDGSGHLQVKNSGGTVIATGTTVLLTNTWHYIEVKLVVGTSGSVEVHLDGVTEIASTTGNFGTTNVDRVGIEANGGSSITADFDDMVILDTTGSSPNNTFLGDVRVETLNPNGAGTHTAWTANGAGSNYQCVDETTPDGDTTYVSDATPGDIDTYLFAHVDAGATVFAVNVNLYARKDDANTRQIAPVIRQASTDHVGTTVTLGSSYAYYSQIYNQDPTGSAWTAANVNADEYGVKEIA